MKNPSRLHWLVLWSALAAILSQPGMSRETPDPGDPHNPLDIPGFYKSSANQLEGEVRQVKKGESSIVATSPGGLPVYAVYYGQKENFPSRAKSVHPMQGDVGILGAYFNDEGINMMHDDWFSPMAAETKAILEIARSEAPDLTVSLHSHPQKSRILPSYYVPWYVKMHIDTLIRRVNERYATAGLPSIPDDRISLPAREDESYPPRTSFNPISALRHVSGTMAFTFGCSHGTVGQAEPEPQVSHSEILDIQLLLYQEMLDYALEHPLY